MLRSNISEFENLGILTNTGKRTGPQGWNTVQITIDQIGLVLWYNKVS